MPHLVFECSETVFTTLAFQTMFVEFHQMLAALLPTQLSSCKSRLLLSNQYLVGNDTNNLFLHLTIKILPGRSLEVKQAVVAQGLEIIKNYLAKRALSNVSISIEIIDLAECYSKETL